MLTLRSSLHNQFFLGPGTLFLENFSSALEGKNYEVSSSTRPHEITFSEPLVVRAKDVVAGLLGQDC